MSTKVGLWIDHRKAIVVAITEQGEKIEEIVSEVEKQLQRAGDSPGEQLSRLKRRLRDERNFVGYALVSFFNPTYTSLY
jgi:hypothetical protein